MQCTLKQINKEVIIAVFTANMFTFKKEAKDSLVLSFTRIGGRVVENGEVVFPSFVNYSIIERIIKNTCFVCGGLMKDGVTLDNSYITHVDFGNDAGQRGTTQEKSGHPTVKQVRKCTNCGHSHT